MALIPFLSWLPDVADLGNKGSPTIKNALPGVTSYKPFGSHSPLTDALTAMARGAVQAVDKSGTVYQFAGDASKLYELSSTTWGDVSKTGGYSTASEERWDFVRWKNQVLATNYTDNPQFMELGGTNFTDLTTDFKSRNLAVIGDFVVAANTTDSSSGAVPDRVRWSAFNDATDWTVSPSTGSDYQDLKNGPIQRVFGGEYGVILGTTSTWRMNFVGAPAWFEIHETIPGIGTLSPRAAVRIGGLIFAWSNQGFVAISEGTGFTRIGAGVADEFAQADLDNAYMWRISAAVDPGSGRVFWAYPGSGNSGGTPNKIICFDQDLNKWSLIEQEVELLWSAGGVAMTLEDLDSVSSSIDSLGASLDSSRWKGSQKPSLAAFDSSHKHGFFDGTPKSATFETKESEIHAGQRTTLNAFRPLIDGGSVTAQVGTRNSQSESVTWGAVLSPTSTGRFTTRSNARYHRFRLTASDQWEDAIGVQIDQSDARPAGRRG